jgi:hypothetical protein
MPDQFVEVNGLMVKYFEKELFCPVLGFRKWTDNYGYIWFTDENQSFLGESLEEINHA